MDRTVTLIITSCGRLDLLARTIASFDQWNTFPLNDRIIIDDSGDLYTRKELERQYSSKFNIYHNETRLGQIESIDKAYSKVKTNYIFHCEDDWEFTRAHFIEESLTILESNPRILQVWLRGDLFHEKERFDPILRAVNGITFYHIVSNWSTEHPNWSPGFSFNPGLRRTEDYAKIAPYKAIGHEHEIQKVYQEAGYSAVILERYVVEHIGWDRTVSDPTCGPSRLKSILCLVFPRLRSVSLRRLFNLGAFKKTS